MERLMNIEQFKKQLQAVDNPESRFLSRVSSKMNTNLDGILGFTQLLASQRPGKLNPKQTRYVSEIYESGRELHSLISDYIDLARIESGMLDLNISKLDFSEYILWALDVLAPQMNSRRLSFTVFWDSPTEMIYGDAVRIKQILFALFSKAIEFSLEGERLFLHISFDDEFLKVRLENDPDGNHMAGSPDERKGFVPDSLPHESNPASDLSLALAGKLIQLHGGRLGLEYDESGRSYLSFTLRKNALSSNGSHVADRKDGGETPKAAARILLIDDSSNIQNLVTEILKKEHYKVFVADNGRSGLEMARSCRPDMIFMDINMPVMDGTETIRKLREIPELKHTPVVALTAEDTDNSGQFLLDLGFDYLVGKPFNRSDLFNSIYTCLPPQTSGH